VNGCYRRKREVERMRCWGFLQGSSGAALLLSDLSLSIEHLTSLDTRASLLRSVKTTGSPACLVALQIHFHLALGPGVLTTYQ
jgi:hypothetical protein